jgi:hypothetical protein
MVPRIIAVCAVAVLAVHFTGNMKNVAGWFDIGIDARHWLYLVALPFAAICGLAALRDT